MRVFRFIANWSDPVLVAALTAGGLWVVVCKPWGLDGPTAGALAGALFGGAAVLLGILINRANQRHEKMAEVEERRAKLKALIAAEIVNVTAGVLSVKSGLSAAVDALKSGAQLGQINLADYTPREMSMTSTLTTELMTLDMPSLDALTTLRASLERTRLDMAGAAPQAKTTNGFTLTIAVRLSNAVAHDMELLAQVFEHIAPNRQLKLADKDPELASVILRREAQ